MNFGNLNLGDALLKSGKRNREDYLTKEFFSQFDSRDYEAVKQLVYKLNKSIGWGSGVLKVEIQNR